MAVVTGATQTVTITTTSPHGFAIGQVVTIANVSQTGYNGVYTIASVPSTTTFTYTVTTSLSLSNATGGTATYNAPQVSAISSISEVGALVTVTTAAPHDFSVGQQLVISGVGVAGYDGTFEITSVASTTTFTYAGTSGLVASSGGTAALLTPIFAGNIVAAAVTGNNMPNTDFPYVLYMGTGQPANPLGTAPANGTTFTISGATEGGTTVTITTSAVNAFYVGESVSIAGVSPAGFDGTFSITGINSYNKFTYTDVAGLLNNVTLTVSGATATGLTTNSFYGSGVYQSLNGGQSWTLLTQAGTAYAGNNAQIAAADSANPLGYAGTTVSKVVVDPVDSSIIFVAVSDLDFTGSTAQTPDNAGIWKYVSSTRTWSSLTSPLTSTISNISVSAATSPQTVTVTTSTALGLTVGETIAITGDSHAVDNVSAQTVTSIGVNNNNQPYFTFTYTFGVPANAMVNDGAPATAIVTGTPQSAAPAEGGHPIDIEQVGGTETIFVTFASNATSITASGVPLTATNTAGTTWSLAFSNGVEGNSFTLNTTGVVGGTSYSGSTAITWTSNIANLEALLASAFSTLNGGSESLGPTMTLGVTITETTANPQYFDAGQPLNLLEASSNVGSQNQTFTPTSVSSTTVTLTGDTTWGLYNSSATLTGYDYSVYFYAQSVYSDLWVYQDPVFLNNLFIAFAEGAPGGGTEVVEGNGNSGANRFSNGVYISLNNGTTYQEQGFPTTGSLWVTGVNNTNAQTAADGVIKFAVTVNATSDGASTVFTFYASQSTTAGATGGLQDASITWASPVGGVGPQWILSPWAAPASSPANYLGSDGNYANAAVAVLPSNANIVFVAGQGTGIDARRPDTDVEPTAAPGPGTTFPTGANGPSSAVYTMTVQTFGGNNYLLVGTDGGIWRYNISAGTWADLNGNLDVTQFNSIAVSANNNAEIGLAAGAIVGNGVIETSGTTQWNYVGSDDGQRRAGGHQSEQSPLRLFASQRDSVLLDQRRNELDGGGLAGLADRVLLSGSAQSVAHPGGKRSQRRQRHLRVNQPGFGGADLDLPQLRLCQRLRRTGHLCGRGRLSGALPGRFRVPPRYRYRGQHLRLEHDLRRQCQRHL